MNLKIEKIYNEVSELFAEGKYQDAYNKIESVDVKLQGNNVIEYLRAVCNQEVGNIAIAIKQFTQVLDKDPTFIKIAETLIDLNKSSYSIGELKYFYELILSIKPNNQQMHAFVGKHHNVPSQFYPEPNIQKMKKVIHSLPIKKSNGKNRYINPLIRELELNAEKYKNDIKNNGEKKSKKDKPVIMPDFDAESTQKQNKKISDKLKDNSSKKKNYNKDKEDNKKNKGNGNNRVINVETLTIARLYIKQGYYKEALDILFKIKKQDGSNNEKILETIKEVKKLIKQGK
jgi:tetratricopeptide (TPR) repeat protein